MGRIELTSAERRNLLERFLRYVQVDTQSDENSETSPSTSKQKDLSALLAAELKALGCEDARMDEWGYVTASVPGNVPAGHPAAGKVPTIGLLAHVDTYHGTLGAGVKPQVIEKYAGGDIALPGDATRTLLVSENPNLPKCVGHTLVTTDGTTLLGADDKAGVAEIVTVAAWLKAHPEFLHGTLRIGFTTDEEVGRGTEHFDVPGFAARYAYTLDGSDLGEIEDETFSADLAVVTVEGRDVHPGYAKGKMVNAVRVAADLVSRLPHDGLPETTELRQAYLHPYDLKGDVTKVEMKVLVRAFSVEELHQREGVLRGVAVDVEEAFPGAKIRVEIREQYRNMGYKLADEPCVMECAFDACRRQGIEPIRKAIRGGTDGSRLSYMGLLTPNVWAGGQNFHSVQEWVSLEWMGAAVETSLQLLTVWLEKSA